jgi:glucose/mannose-6-phosphate isomerase
VISSYSGNTEEPLSLYEAVKKRKAKVAAITSKSLNNQLAVLMAQKRIPGFIFDPENNPSSQPRLGLGYAVFGAIKLLEKTGTLKITSETAREVVAGIKGRNPFMTVNVKTGRNVAKKTAYHLKDKIVILVGSEFLQGNIHVFRNQLNENGKNLAVYLISPDMNHYALESLENPKDIKDKIVFLFIDSSLYSPRVQKRNMLVKQLIRQKGIAYRELKLRSRIKLAQSFELLQFGSWVSYYLALLNEIDPSSIPWVNWFKERLK